MEFRLADASSTADPTLARGNELLRAFTRWTLDVLQPSLVEAVGDAFNSASRSFVQHREILRAIRRGQPAAAERRRDAPSPGAT